MRLAYPALSEVIPIGENSVPCLIIENRRLFRTLLCDAASAIDGNKTEMVLSEGDRILDMSKNAEILSDFICFDLNRKTLLNRIIGEMEKIAVSPEHYMKTRELLTNIENIIGEWAFPFPCDIVAGKISVSTLLKSSGIELRDEYEGHRGEVEKILDYIELVREFDRNKLFMTVNMRSFFDDEIIAEFMKTAISHEYRVLMLESQAYPKLALEKRVIIDADLCEF